MLVKRTLASVALVTPLAMLGATPAFADDPQPLPDNPEVVIGYDNETEIFPAKAAPPPMAMSCRPGDATYRVSAYSNSHKAVGPTQSNHNATSRTATSTFAATVSGTVSIAWNVSGSLKVDRLIAGAEVATGVNLSASLTASLGNSIAVPTPPRKTTTATYGVWRKKTNGIYQVCGQRGQRRVTAWTPWHVGWYVKQR
ncbi:hypothetical protein [Nonomuraea roseoviolacea]|uniref:Uncharacterized protein n=1 Tax=Nonomuraea roseoviolacea subsp. carminata TaxID=160689 RepID=A0ABT1K296_9ACTN|nr:hypothetical protein [Nonomuraea roseoviolacea]MCP2348120.1 hypothetical protein [Nonomuraea roseoviolacea subsp. carminata]